MENLEYEKQDLLKLIESNFDKSYLESLIVTNVLPENLEEPNYEITICEKGAFYAC
jgi:hypothetical protein